MIHSYFSKVQKKLETIKTNFTLYSKLLKRPYSLELISYAIIIAVIILDQLTKYIIKTKMYLYESIPVIKNVFHLTYTTNSGAGFGILQDYRWFFIAFTVVFLVSVYYFYTQHKLKYKNNLYFHICVALLLGGALGNFYDRLRFGYVVDFLDFRVWPAFNIADSAVTVAAIGLVIWLWKK